MERAFQVVGGAAVTRAAPGPRPRSRFLHRATRLRPHHLPIFRVDVDEAAADAHHGLEDDVSGRFKVHVNGGLICYFRQKTEAVLRLILIRLHEFGFYRFFDQISLHFFGHVATQLAAYQASARALWTRVKTHCLDAVPPVRLAQGPPWVE